MEVTNLAPFEASSGTLASCMHKCLRVFKELISHLAKRKQVGTPTKARAGF